LSEATSLRHRIARECPIYKIDALTSRRLVTVMATGTSMPSTARTGRADRFYATCLTDEQLERRGVQPSGARPLSLPDLGQPIAALIHVAKGILQ
jgi:hypothetical protein